jgi:hypothetical protein
MEGTFEWWSEDIVMHEDTSIGGNLYASNPVVAENSTICFATAQIWERKTTKHSEFGPN